MLSPLTRGGGGGGVASFPGLLSCELLVNTHNGRGVALEDQEAKGRRRHICTFSVVLLSSLLLIEL